MSGIPHTYASIVPRIVAIVSGGPGALFWMWLAALVGTATKYSECLLAVKFRQVDEDGTCTDCC